MRVTPIAVAGFLGLVPWLVGCAEDTRDDGSPPATQSAPVPVEPAPLPPASADVAEVLANILAQPIGEHTVADLALPERFLRRIADRVIRDAYQDRFHTVYDDGVGIGMGFPPPGSPATDAARGAQLVTVRAAERAPELIARRRDQAEGRPPRRGYRPDEPWRSSGVGSDIVATRLARDGLLSTLARVIERRGPAAVAGDDASVLESLRATGLPVDLLGHFAVRGDGSPGPPIAIVRHVAQRLDGGRTAASLAKELSAYRFDFAKTHAGFEVSSESGEHAIGLMRIQLTRGGYWLAPGEGGSVDVLRELVTRLPDVAFLASIETQHVDALVALAGAWPLGEPGRLTLVAEPLTVAQWAHDNGKAGIVRPGGEWATIVPRYASRQDDGSVYVPGESSLAEGLAAAGQVIVRSSLLFQGGNLLAVRNPANGERMLLVGEADIYRNTALGLTRGQVESAFRVEFGVDRVIVLPSVSFHLDYDVSVRAVDGRLVAFVNDPGAAARAIVRCGAEAMLGDGTVEYEGIADAELAGMQAHLDAGRDHALARAVGACLAGNPAVPVSLARLFASGPDESPVGNLQRFRLAIAVLLTADLEASDLPPPGPARSFIDALRRLEAHRVALHDALRELGFRVVPVPSLAAGARSVTFINGIHDRTRYLMPAYGGLYAPVDAVARAAFEAELGAGVEVIPIPCAESQRRSGAVHCSVSAYPAR